MEKEPVAYKILHVQREQEGHKKCPLIDGCPIPKPRRYLFSSSFFPPIPKPIPEHPMALISKNTTRNKACQTPRTYNPHWPEIHMDPTEYLITPKKRTRNITLMELTTTQTNDKTTQTVQTKDRHNKDTPVLHSDDATPVSNVLSLQTLPAKNNKTETQAKHGGRDMSLALE